MRYIFVLCILLTSCFLSHWDARISIVNETDKKIRYEYEFTSEEKSLDTADCKQHNFYDIPPKTDYRMICEINIDKYFERHPQGFLRIYLINEDSLQKYGVCQILNQQIFMKQYDLSHDDLVKMNWRIEYKE